MFIYLVLFIYTCVMGVLYRYSKSECICICRKRIDFYKSLLFVFMIFPMILVSGLRYGISIDYVKVYERGFNIIASGAVADVEFEKGFVFLVQLCTKIGSEPWIMFLTVAVITITTFMISFHESENYVLSLILFLGMGIYFDTFNGIRQYIVVGIFCYSIRYIKERNIKRYIIVMGLSVFIHTSAVLTIPMYFLGKVKVNMIYVLTISALMFGFRGSIYNLLIQLMQVIPKYSTYILRDALDNQISFSLSGLLTALIALIPCLLVEKKMQETIEGNFLLNMMYLGLIIAVASSFFPFAERLLYYTKAYILFALPFACSLLKRKIREICVCGVTVLLCGMNVIGMIMLDWYAVLPYVSIFSR